MFSTSVYFHRSQKRHNILQNETQYTQYKMTFIISILSIECHCADIIVTLNFVVLGVEALAENALAYLASDEGKKSLITWRPGKLFEKVLVTTSLLLRFPLDDVTGGGAGVRLFLLAFIFNKAWIKQ